MPRKPTILQSEFPYWLGGRCINRDWFGMPMPEVWEVFSEVLYLARTNYDFITYGFVLMANHFHLLGRTPQANLCDVMQFIMGETSRRIVKVSGRINCTWGAPYYRSIVSSQHHFLNCYKYLYYNPVKAGLCRAAEAYPYSTLHGLLGFERLLIPVCEDKTLFPNVEETLRWLNTPPTQKNWDSVRAALKREKFQLRKDPDTNRPNILEIDTL